MKITFFTTCKPFNESNVVRQTNTLNNLANINTDKDVVLFSEESEIQAKEICDNNSIDFITEFRKSQNTNIPYVDDLFSRVQDLYNSDFYCYINCDMILLDDFVESLTLIHSEVKPRQEGKSIFVCGRRLDTEDFTDTYIDFSNKSSSDILEMCPNRSLHSEYGIDYFVFEKGMFLDMPNFLIARTVFDNSIVGHSCVNPDIFEIDITHSTNVIHQDHEYGEMSNESPYVLYDRYPDEFSANKGLASNHWPLFSINNCRNYLQVDQTEEGAQWTLKQR
tara:strand:- start:7376 stop:8209 length:834 start_codon:yes stop_codon:yes gene_type:complete